MYLISGTMGRSCKFQPACSLGIMENLTCLKSRITENKTYPRSGVKLYSSVATQIHITADCSSPDCMVGEGGECVVHTRSVKFGGSPDALQCNWETNSILLTI